MSINNDALTLDQLSDQEFELCKRVATLSGTIEARQEQLQLSGIGKNYQSIHYEYLALAAHAADASTRLEALKRVVFLSWYGNEMVEPDFFSGLAYVDSSLIRASYKQLDYYLAEYTADPEMQWMLSFYSSWHDFIPAFSDVTLPYLLAFVAAVDHTVLHVPKCQLPAHTMDHRGQMGLYWQSMGVENISAPSPSQ